MYWNSAIQILYYTKLNSKYWRVIFRIQLQIPDFFRSVFAAFVIKCHTWWPDTVLTKINKVLSVGIIELQKTHRPIPVWQQLKFKTFLTLTLFSLDQVSDKVFNFVINTTHLVAWELRSYRNHWRVKLEISSFNSCPSLGREVRPQQGDNYHHSNDYTEHWHNGRYVIRWQSSYNTHKCTRNIFC